MNLQTASRLVVRILLAVSLPAAGISAALGTPVAIAAADAPSKLGDLTPFRSIAVEVLAKVEQRDLTGAVKRIKDLEVAWDTAEAGLKPRAPAVWHTVDKAIDRVLSELRARKPDPAASTLALKELLAAFDAAR